MDYHIWCTLYSSLTLACLVFTNLQSLYRQHNYFIHYRRHKLANVFRCDSGEPL
jgi:hypothetical protein